MTTAENNFQEWEDEGPKINEAGDCNDIPDAKCLYYISLKKKKRGNES
jgi:hypothetical protein